MKRIRLFTIMLFVAAGAATQLFADLPPLIARHNQIARALARGEQP